MFNPKTHSLVLRACNADMTSYNGRFVWPTNGFVKCPDWNPQPKLGNGLHGWLYGHGKGSFNTYWEYYTKWLVVSVETSTIVNLDGLVKFKSGNVLFCGTQKEATDFLMKHEPRSLSQPIIGAYITAREEIITTGHEDVSTTGYKGTSTSGDCSKSISGDYGTSISGYYGTSTSGNNGNSTSGVFGTSTSGNYGISISGHYGISKSGDYGTSTSGYLGNSTSGEVGTSISGERGTSISGYGGTSTSDLGGKCKAGKKGIITISYYKDDRKRLKIGYIGEDGLEPDVFYELDKNFNFVKYD